MADDRKASPVSGTENEGHEAGIEAAAKLDYQRWAKTSQTWEDLTGEQRQRWREATGRILAAYLSRVALSRDGKTETICGTCGSGCMAENCDRYAPVKVLARDARGDDEDRCNCPDLYADSPECPVHGTAARSPQDEDHEAWAKRFRRAADEAERRGPSEGVDPLIHAAMVEAYRTQADELSPPPPEYMAEADAHRWVDEHIVPPASRHLAHALVSSLPRVAPSRDGTADDGRSWRCTDCNCINREDEAFCFRCGAGQPEFPARVSPSRDGTVAVEDVAAWLDSEANRTAGNGELSDTVAGAIVGVRMRFLAEFSPASTGDREEK